MCQAVGPHAKSAVGTTPLNSTAGPQPAFNPMSFLSPTIPNAGAILNQRYQAAYGPGGYAPGGNIFTPAERTFTTANPLARGPSPTIPGVVPTGTPPPSNHGAPAIPTPPGTTVPTPPGTTPTTVPTSSGATQPPAGPIQKNFLMQQQPTGPSYTPAQVQQPQSGVVNAMVRRFNPYGWY